MLKLNTDGACKGNPGSSTAGDSIHNEAGQWLHGFAANLISNSLLAEAWDVLLGLQLAWDKRYRRLILELDSEVLVHFIRLQHSPCKYSHMLH